MQHKQFIILEPHTGFMDGFYYHRGEARKMIKNWDERREGYKHILVEVLTPFTMPEHMLLADHQYGIVRGEANVHK